MNKSEAVKDADLSVRKKRLAHERPCAWPGDFPWAFHAVWPRSHPHRQSGAATLWPGRRIDLWETPFWRGSETCWRRLKKCTQNPDAATQRVWAVEKDLLSYSVKGVPIGISKLISFSPELDGEVERVENSGHKTHDERVASDHDHCTCT